MVQTNVWLLPKPPAAPVCKNGGGRIHTVMKYMLALYLLLPVLAAAQPGKYNTLVAALYKDSAGQPVELPYLRDIDLYQKPNLFIPSSLGLVIASDSSYKSLFFMTQPDSLPVIDFTTHYLLGVHICKYCGLGCTHVTCHRQRCSYTIHWAVLPKKPVLPVAARL